MRLLLVVLLLAVALAPGSVRGLGAALALLLIILLIRGRAADHLQRGWHLLRWLLIPVVALHLVFTQGTLLFPDAPWSPSVEGIQGALTRALRLIDWFLAAVISANLLTTDEWKRVLRSLPLIPDHWKRAVAALPPLLHVTTITIRQMRHRWRMERPPLRDFPASAAAAVAMILWRGDRNAEAYWLTNSSPTPRNNGNR